MEKDTVIQMLINFVTHIIAILLRRVEGGKMSLENNESEIITSMKKNLEVQMGRNESLEKENKDLRQEVARLKSQIVSLKAHNIERKSMLWKKIQKSMEGNNSDHKSTTMSEKNLPTNISDLQEQEAHNITKDKSAKVPTPPPRPNSNTPFPSQKNEKGSMKVQPFPLPTTTPPPPPPTPPKSLGGLKAVRRVPEVIELYRSLTRKDANKDNKINSTGTPIVAFTRNMIEEIENRSSFLSAIKSDVERQGELISLLTKEIERGRYSDMCEVEAFVKWLDGELSSLVDERSVLKHFPQWPEQKADALREASCNYRELKSLESEVSSFEDNPKEPLPQALKRMQALEDRLERSVSSAERTRESASKRYRSFHIPWEWMLDTGLIGQLKLSSLKLAREFMKRITRELEWSEALQEDNLMVQGVRFAFRVHQFAGGFDTETIQAFQELKRIGMACNKL